MGNFLEKIVEVCKKGFFDPNFGEQVLQRLRNSALTAEEAVLLLFGWKGDDSATLNLREEIIRWVDTENAVRYLRCWGWRIETKVRREIFSDRNRQKRQYGHVVFFATSSVAIGNSVSLRSSSCDRVIEEAVRKAERSLLGQMISRNVFYPNAHTLLESSLLERAIARSSEGPNNKLGNWCQEFRLPIPVCSMNLQEGRFYASLKFNFFGVRFESKGHIRDDQKLAEQAAAADVLQQFETFISHTPYGPLIVQDKWADALLLYCEYYGVPPPQFRKVRVTKSSFRIVCSLTHPLLGQIVHKGGVKHHGPRGRHSAAKEVFLRLFHALPETVRTWI